MASAAVAPAQVLPGTLAPLSESFPEQAQLASNEVPVPTTPALDELAPQADDALQASDIVKALPGEGLTAMVARLRSSDTATHQLACLATAIYFEAKSEPLAGQLAVGEVLANRVKSGRFATSYCGVVMQRGQFSFIHNNSLPGVSHSSAQWKNAVAIATIVDSKLKSSEAPRALFFHAKRVSPSWNATRVATIGNHIFYR